MGWVVLLVVLVIATGVAIYYWRMMYRIHPQTQMIINMLLSHAELQMTDSHLMEPPGANAYQSYRNVLDIDPHNEQALEGLEKIADHFQTQALSK